MTHTQQAKKKKTAKQILALLLVMGFSASCQMSSMAGQSSSFEDSSNGNGIPENAHVNYQNVLGDDIVELDLSTASSHIPLDDLNDSDSVVLALYSFSNTSQSNSFQISENASTELSFSIAAHLDSEDQGEGDFTESFHGQLQDWEETLDPSYAHEPADLQFSISEPDVGSTRKFKVLNTFSSSTSYESITAVLMYSGKYFNYYVDSRDMNALNADAVKELSQTFEKIIPIERDLFGVESDVDGDGKFNVVSTQVVNRLTQGGGGFITGFFLATDLYSSSQYSISNQTEVIYTMVPDPTGQHGSTVNTQFTVDNILKGVLPHEYQHLISYNQHVFVNRGLTEESWLNEGLSHLAEDLTSLVEKNNLGLSHYESQNSQAESSEDFMMGYGKENPSRVSSYLAQVSNVCFTCGSSLSQRGGAYLFVKYLYEKAEKGYFQNLKDGKDLIRYLLDTNLRGINNVVHAIYDSGDESLFQELMADFTLTLYFAGSDYADDEFNFIGIDLRGLAYDNRGTYLNGPSVQTVDSLPFVDSLNGSSVSFVEIPRSIINEQSDILSVIKSANGDVGAFLIQ